MYPGFEFNQDPKAPTMDYQQKRFPEPGQNYTANPEKKHVYNFKAPPFEEHHEGSTIPQQIRALFDPEGASLENKNKAVVGSRTSVASHSTVDSRGPAAASNPYGNPNQSGSTGMNVSGGTGMNMSGGMGNNQNNSGMRFPSFNMLMNQANDFSLKSVSNDLNTSNISNKDSRTISLNNLSRDSANNSRMDLNTSNRRNTSSRANVKSGKNYQVNINEDISLIERMEVMLNQITMNHNKVCPFCSKVIDIKKCNFQNISAFLSNSSKKYYLTHFDCYLKSNSNPASAKIVPLSGVVEARINQQINSLSNIDTSNFLRSDRRAYFVSIEGYHPISSYLLFRIEKICHGLEHAAHRNQLLYLNMSNKTTSIFEPTSYMIPFSEFRMIVNIHLTHASEDPYTYEYLVDFSQVKLSAEQKSKFAEVLCTQEGNSILIAAQIIYDPNSELANSVNYKMNLDTSFQSTGSTTPAKPDFGKNVFVAFKHFSINLPLKRVERQVKEPQLAPVMEETNFEQPKLTTSQKKPHSRLQLNPNAPLFTNAHDHHEGQPFVPNVNQPTVPGQNFGKQEPELPQPASKSLEGQGFNPSKMPFENPSFTANTSSSNNAFQPSNNRMLFNNPYQQNLSPDQQSYLSSQLTSQQQQQFQELNYPSSLMRGQGQGQSQMQGQGQGQGQFQSQHQQEEMVPPGLGINLPRGGPNTMNYPNYPQNVFQKQTSDPSKPKGLYGENVQPQGFQPMQNMGPNKNVMGSYEESNEGRNQNFMLPQDIYEREPTNEEGQNMYRQPNRPDMERDYQNEDPTSQPENTYMPDREGATRGRMNRPASLYTAVLSGKKRDNSVTNSPSLQTMQNRYFSGVSTPLSEHEPTVNTPLSQSNNDFLGGDEGSNPSLSEEMIENFRLEDRLGELVEFAKTYNGSRILQKFFPKANQNEVEIVLREIEDKLEELMLDPYANYMFQTLAQSCSADQRYYLLKKIAPSMVEIACDRKGTHSLQALIALVSRDIEEQLLRDTLHNHIVELSFDPQGTHLIQKLISSISMNNIDFIFEPLVERFTEVANHSFGLCVLKQLITKVEKVPELRRRLIRLLYDGLENLIQNPFGNYALQHALDTFQQECNPLFEKTFDKIVQYSNQKFSSNVIEKALIVASPEYKKRFVRELAKSDRIVELMKNKYGNFVLLKALKSVDLDDRQVIMQSLLKNIGSVTMSKYRNSWTKFIEENPLKVPGLNLSQSIKPSIFKSNSNYSEGAGNSDKEVGDTISPKSLEPWNEAKKEAAKKGVKDLKEDKSQFYHESNPSQGGKMMERPGFGEDDRENMGLKENIMEGRMGNEMMSGNKEMMQQQAQKKGTKNPNPNQKFYSDQSQHYPNKWGFNNFY